MSRKHIPKGVSEIDVDVSKMYVVQHPTPLSDLTLDDLNPTWRNQARDLIARRSHKLNQMS
jgi:nitrous oxide reductase accessory protein NosL